MDKKKVNRYYKQVNTTLDDNLKDRLSALAENNELTLSALLRFVGGRVADQPEKFGLRPVKQESK